LWIEAGDGSAEAPARRLNPLRYPRVIRGSGIEPSRPSAGLHQMDAADRQRVARRRGGKALAELGLQAIPEGCGAPVRRGAVESGGERRRREGARERCVAQAQRLGIAARLERLPDRIGTGKKIELRDLEPSSVNARSG
jgi:hypothetical protein